MQDMMTDVLEQSDNEDRNLVARLIGEGTPKYVIRRRLMESGYSAVAANRLITQTRDESEKYLTYTRQIEALLKGIVLLFAVIVIILYIVFPIFTGR